MPVKECWDSAKLATQNYHWIEQFIILLWLLSSAKRNTIHCSCLPVDLNDLWVLTESLNCPIHWVLKKCVSVCGAERALGSFCECWKNAECRILRFEAWRKWVCTEFGGCSTETCLSHTGFNAPGLQERGFMFILWLSHVVGRSSGLYMNQLWLDPANKFGSEPRDLFGIS